jgi:coenzyme F420-reducing hydrogenase beta subunit
MRVADLDSSFDGELSHIYDKICPFGEQSLNETELAKIFFPSAPQEKRHIGRYWKNLAGNVTDSSTRERASSGGVARWLSDKLLSSGEVDGIVNVISTPNNDGQPLFKYDIISNSPEVKNAAKSAYYPTSMDGVLKEIKNMDGSYLFTGVPCFIKALRLLSLEDEQLRAKIKYTVGIVCGHMKSEAYAELIGWQMGVKPNELKSIDFRGKGGGKKASVKLNIIQSSNGETYQETSGKLFGTGYSLGLFKPKACDFCDDVLAETADISIGDAWLEKYVHDVRGTSLIVVRNQQLLNVLESGKQNKELDLDELKTQEVLSSQEGGLRHRNEGLACRLATYKKLNLWAPKKRVQSNWKTAFTPRRRLYELRHTISQKSHNAFLTAKKMQDINYFMREMADLVKEHNRILRRSRKSKQVKTKLHALIRGKF